MVDGHRIDRFVEIPEFQEKIQYYSKEQIKCTDHTFFRLSQEQRELFQCDEVKEYILDTTPILVGIQKNGCYALFYKYKGNLYIRVMVDIDIDKIEAVTFYIVEEYQIPRRK